jgi:Rhodopirellula transposase DDE domain
MFCHITENWRGQPLVSHEVIIQLIGSTTTTTGLTIRAELDKKSCPRRQGLPRRIEPSAHQARQLPQ